MSNIFLKRISIRLEVNFSLKHQLICNDYHYNVFYLSLYVGDKPDNHLVVFFLSFYLYPTDLIHFVLCMAQALSVANLNDHAVG